MLRKKKRRRQVRRVLRPRPLDHDPGRPRDDRQHGAGIRRDLRFLPDRQGDAGLSHDLRPDLGDRVELVEAYAKEQGLYRNKHTRGPGVHRHARPRPRRSVVPSMAGPKRPEGRIALPRTSAPASSPRSVPSTRRPANVETRSPRRRQGLPISAMATSSSRRSRLAPTPRIPSVLIGAGLLARKAAEKGLTSQAVGEDLAGARAARWWRNISRPIPACRRISTSWDSTSIGFGCTTCIGNSGPLAEPKSRRPSTTIRHRRRRRALGQPQLRGPRLARRAGELPRLAAAGGGACHRRHGEARPRPRIRSARTRTARTSF